MSLISCKDVSLSYENRIIVSGLGFSVEKGDYLCIVGENGSGKTTLMKALLGLREVSSGKIVYGDGLEKNRIGYLPQQTEVQRDFPATVREVVFSGCTGRRRKTFASRFRLAASSEDKRRVAEALALLGIDGIKNECYKELSGGQQQRVLLARALCATESLILLDEPVTGLDPRVSSEMYGLIEKLNRENGITVIMISHDILSAVRYSDHILHIGGHKPLFFGSTSDYVSSEIGKIFIKGAENSALGGE